MFRLLTVAALILPCTLSAAQAQGSLSDVLTNAFKTKILTSKKLFGGGGVRLDQNGEFIDGADKCESWTLCRTFDIEKITVKEKEIEIYAQRMAIGFPDGKKTAYRIEDHFCTIRINVPAPITANSAMAAIKNVFLNADESPALNLPYAWAKYFDPNTTMTDPALPNGAPVHKKLRVSGGVTAAKLIKKVQIHYPDTAKSFRQEGTVVLGALIGADGKIHSLYVIQPMGFGLDEAAIDAIRKWEYSPTLLKGEPVEVETTITVNFHLYR